MNSPHAQRARESLQLTVDLQEGFDGEEVVLRVSGREVFRRSDVHTRMQIGRAASFTIDTDGSRQELELSIPNRGLAQKTSVDPRRHPYLGFSIKEGRIHVKESVRPFGYL